MIRVPYAKLAQIYDMGWGDFAESSRSFVASTLVSLGVPNGRVLELACGTGILAHHLSKGGYDVVGVDRSPEMIVQARQRSEGLENLEFIVSDMREITLTTRFDAALCMFDSLNYLTVPEDVANVMHSVASALRPKGVFIFDFNRPLVYSAHNDEVVRRRLPDGVLTQEMHYEVADRLARTTFHFPDGETEIHLQRAYEMDEISPLLSSAGLRLDGCYADFTRRPGTAISERIIYVCVKS